MKRSQRRFFVLVIVLLLLLSTLLPLAVQAKPSEQAPIELRNQPYNSPGGAASSFMATGQNRYAATGYLDGHVYDALTSAPIVSAMVQTVGSTATTDPSGYFTMTLSVGTYPVTATHPQYVTIVTPSVTIVTGTVTTVDFHLQPRGHLFGYVTDVETGLALDATVTADDDTTASTDPATGFYEMYLDPGTHLVTATAPAHVPGSASVTMTLGQDTQQDLPLWSSIAFVPKPVHVFLAMSDTRTITVTMLNRMAQDYPFQFFEVPGGYIPPRGIQASPQATWPGPDGFGYEGQTVDIQWIEIGMTETIIPGLGDDSNAGPFDIGFPFPFYANNWTQFYVSSNGFLTFGVGDSTYANICSLPNAGPPTNAVYIMWDDLYPNYVDGGVYYQYFAACPIGAGACTVVEYKNWEHCCDGTSSGTFEIILMENGSIMMQYLDTGDEQGSGSTTGLDGDDVPSDYGLTFSCDTPGSLLPNTAYCYAYPGTAGCVTAEVPWVGEIPLTGTIPAQGRFIPTLVFTATEAEGTGAPGDYYATLLVHGDPTVLVHITMTVISGCDPVDILDVSAETDGCVATMNSLVTGTQPIEYIWSLAGITSTQLNPIFDLRYSGAYGGLLEVSNCDGIAYDAQPFSVTVECPPCEPVTATNFAWTPITPSVGQPVSFAAAASGTLPILFEWDLGDGTSDAGVTVTHTYTQTGFYTVTVRSTNCYGEGHDQAVRTLFVLDPVHAADFTWLPITPTAGEAVQFVGVATGTLPIFFAWDFGDNTFGTGITVTHVYTTGGVYTVTMTATNGNGQAVDVAAYLVTVRCVGMDQVGISWTPPNPTAGQATDFSALVIGGTAPFGYAWAFGDGAVGIGITATHTYLAAGNYTVALTVTDACGEMGASVLVVVQEEPGQGWWVYLPVVSKHQ